MVPAVRPSLPERLVCLPAVWLLAASAWSLHAPDPGSPARPQQTEPPTSEALEFFERSVRPVLVESCLECHGTKRARPRGGLRLDHAEGWRRGGDRGPAIVPGDPDASLLVRAVRYDDFDLQMPPDGRLAAERVAVLERWVAMGAPDPRTEEQAAQPTAGIDRERALRHWAFQPMRDDEPPAIEDAWVRNEIDRFVLAELRERGLRPAPRAGERQLVRRLFFDLLGLPPSPEEIEAHLADREPGAWGRLVDRLLESPHYGERWGRHWLDVARYADSNGVDENLALANAWRYRDWVVEAFNEDLPYDRFVRMQLAGDLLPEPDPSSTEEDDRFDRFVATGFLQLGPKMLAEQDKEKLVMDVVDEQIDVLSKAFLGLTVGCARCHDHKFDPIPTADYYALAGILKSTSTLADLEHVSRWRERPLASDEAQARAQAVAAAIERTEAAIEELHSRAEGDLARAWRRGFADYLLAGEQAARLALFVEAEDASRTNLAADDAQWGSPDAVVLHTREPGAQFAEWDLSVPAGARYELWLRYASGEERALSLSVEGQPFDAPVAGASTGSFFPEGQRWERVGVLSLLPGRNVLRLEREGPVPHLDKLLLAPLPGPASEAAQVWPAGLTLARGLVPEIVRNFADRLVRSARADEGLFRPWRAFAGLPEAEFAQRAPRVLAELRARQAEGAGEDEGSGGGVAQALLDAPPPASLRELAARYQTLFAFVDPIAERSSVADASQGEQAPPLPPELEPLARLARGPASPFRIPRESGETLYPPELRERLANLRAEQERLTADRPAPFDQALAVQEGSEPADVPVHVRGSHLTLADAPTPRGFLSIAEAVVDAPPIPPASSGRAQLAAWLCAPEHPLTARVMVNRIWQGHFGQGIVRSPSNFGLRGERPSHPELLDWLAREFVRAGWSVKAVHRLVLTSSTWAMDSRGDERAAAVDPENRLLARQNRRRLEAECVRDALLAVSGGLDRSLGGTLLSTPNRGYVTNDQSQDQARYAEPRRSLYLPVIRNAMYDFFATFDYADASVPLERRPVTTVASQALALMNSPLVLGASRGFAARVLAGDADDDAALDRAFGLAYGRAPTRPERERCLAWLEREARAPLAAKAAVAAGDSGPSTSAARAPVGPEVSGAARTAAWERLAHVLLCANEFAYVD